MNTVIGLHNNAMLIVAVAVAVAVVVVVVVVVESWGCKCDPL